MVDAGARRRWRGLGRMALGMAWKCGAGDRALVSWINFRWLKGSVQAFGRPRRHRRVRRTCVCRWARTLNSLRRFALLLGILYVILTRSWLPVIPVLTGLFASAAAVVVALVYELVSSGVHQNASGS